MTANGMNGYGNGPVELELVAAPAFAFGADEDGDEDLSRERM